MADAAHIQELDDLARSLGAKHAAPLATALVVVDERVCLKCRVPLCPNYGFNLGCPPFVPSPEETRATLALYTTGVLVQQEIPVYPAVEYSRSHRPQVRESQIVFADLMTALERRAFRLGYRFAAAYGGGECPLCETCVGQTSGQACRRPYEARPSMEAVGIDVVATAANAGLAVSFPVVTRAVWTGHLLLD